MKNIVCKIFFCFLYLYYQLQLLKTVIFRLEFTFFSKNCRKTNLKAFQYQVLTSIEKSEKQLASKAFFRTILQLRCFYFKLTLCERD